MRGDGDPAEDDAPPPAIRGAPFPPEAFAREVVAHRFLNRRFLFLSRPAAVQHVLVANADAYARPAVAARGLEPPIGGGLFLAEGAEWRRQRRVLAPWFAPRALPVLLGHAWRVAEAELDALAAGPSLERVDLAGRLADLAVSAAAAALLGIGLGPYREELRRLTDGYARRHAQPDLFDFLAPAWMPVPRDPARRRFRRRWLALVARMVADRSREDPDGLFALLEETEGPRGLLVPQIATLLVTGSETTGAALFWACHLLAGDRALQARLAEEAAPLAEADAPRPLERLPLSRAVVCEAMRLYPPAFSIVRQALRDDEAGGTPVPRGAIVQTAPWAIQRHRLLWRTPGRFDPSRFLPGAEPPDRFAWLPFGVGPRQCVAAGFALAEVALVLGLLMRRFAVARTTDAPVEPAARITLQPHAPPPFRLTLR